MLHGARGSSQRGVCRQRFVLRAQAKSFAALPSNQSSAIVSLTDGVTWLPSNQSFKRTASPPLNSSVRLSMEEFRVRPGYGTANLMLIEFRGDHRAEGFPPVLKLLEGQLAEFSCTGSWPAPDDFLWECVYAGGTFELSDDWGGLFIIPTLNNDQVVADVSSALEASGQFCRAAELA